MIDATTSANFALFNRKAKDTDEPGKEYPVMTGVISTKEWEIGVFAYKRFTGEGKPFLSLVIRNEDDEQTFGGMLFKDQKKPDAYYGFIQEQFKDEVKGETVYSKSEWQVSVRAKVAEAVDPASPVRKYIAGNIAPSNRRTAASPANESEEALAF
jgi:hypothetical protein